jgi:hypothetical protein
MQVLCVSVFADDRRPPNDDPVLPSSDKLNVSQEALVRRNHFLSAVLVVFAFAVYWSADASLSREAKQ